MKKCTLFLLVVGWLVLSAGTAAAQPGGLPAFKIMLSSGKLFTPSDLVQQKPVVLIYFSPECDHCQQLMNAFFKNVQAFKNAEVVMVTFKPLSEVAAFEQAYQTFKYPNIKVGTEGTTYFLRSYFKLQETPFTALYNKQGALLYSYRKQTPVPELINRLNQIK